MISALLLLALAQATPPPVVQTKRAPIIVGDWAIEDRGTYVGAYTLSAEEYAFGVLCGESCVSYFTTHDSCTVGGVYPALIATSGTASAISARCLLVEDTYVLTFAFDEQMVDAFEVGGKLKVAYGKAGGEIGITAYSLTGALRTTRAAAEEMAIRKAKKDAPAPKRFLGV